MDQREGGVCSSLPAFTLPGVLGSQSVSPSQAVAGTAATHCVHVISQAGGKGAGNWLRYPQSSPLAPSQASHITDLKGRLPGTLRMLNQNKGFLNNLK